MKEIKYPTVEEALYLHSILIERFGGGAAVLDLGLLESALSRPRSGYYRTLSEQAAALLHSLAKNHPFQDGNKRMALALTATFLLINGYRLDSPVDGTVQFIEDVANGKIDTVALIAEWLERYIHAVKS